MRITLIIFLLFILNGFSQDNQTSLSVDSFYGFAIEHDTKLAEAIEGNPYGFLISYNFNKKNANWKALYNYPEFGITALYENANSKVLGEMYGLLAHYNFYLNNRNNKNKLQLSIGFGLAYLTNKYDVINNTKNLALGSNFAATAYSKLNWKREIVKDKLAIQTGIILTHFSNGGVRSPNLGLNTFGINLGLNYKINNIIDFPKDTKPEKLNTKIGYNVEVKSGIHSSKNLQSKQYLFYTFTFMLDKEINQKSTLLVGTDFFITPFLKEYIDQDNPIESAKNKHDKRVGVFVGHELKMNKLIVLTHLGFHVYYPKKYDSRIYERFGFKYKLNKHIFTSLSLKVNLFRAEMTEFGIGYRL